MGGDGFLANIEIKGDSLRIEAIYNPSAYLHLAIAEIGISR
jgi:hypothetical protein